MTLGNAAACFRVGVCATLVFAMPVTRALGEAVANCRDDAIIVFDSSGSMQAPTESGLSRIEIARAAARQVIPQAAKVRNLGLVIYGPGEQARCQKFTLAVPPGPNNADAILAAIDTSRTDGETPLSSAVDAAAEALDYTRKPAVVVLLTDGDENCGRYPCQAAHLLMEKAYRLTVHVIAFRLQPRSFRALRCVARETGGVLLPSNTLDQLVAALTETLICPQITQAPPGTIDTSTFQSRPARLSSSMRADQPVRLPRP